MSNLVVINDFLVNELSTTDLTCEREKKDVWYTSLYKGSCFRISISF